MSKELNEKLRGTREDRFIEYIKNRLTTTEIGDREGLASDYCGRIRTAVAKKHGLKVDAERRSRTKPLGLTPETASFRGHLGNELNRLRSVHPFMTICTMLGMSNTEQKLALEKPYMHNWTVSQIARLAQARGKTFDDMISLANTRVKLGW